MLQLSSKHYDSLNQLQDALQGIDHEALERYMALANSRDHEQAPSKEQMGGLLELGTAVLDANRMLGRILLAVLEDNPYFAHRPRAEWDQVAIVSAGDTTMPANLS